jgi:hypothetical protein
MNLHHEQQVNAYDTTHHDDSFASGYGEESFADDLSDDDMQADLSWIEQADAENYRDNHGSSAQALSWLEGSDDVNTLADATQPGMTLFDEPTDPAAVQQVVASVSQMIPAIIRAVGQHPQAREIFEAEAGIPFEQVDADDAEVWPAIIGAIASAVPAIVGAVSQAVRGNQRRRAPASPRPRAPTRQTRTTPPCPPAARREDWPGEDDAEYDAEAVQLAALIPVLMQLLPVIIPLINQMIPLLTKALPALLSSFGKMAGGKKTAKESADDMPSPASYELTEACQTEDILGGAADIDIAAEDLS